MEEEDLPVQEQLDDDGYRRRQSAAVERKENNGSSQTLVGQHRIPRHVIQGRARPLRCRYSEMVLIKVVLPEPTGRRCKLPRRRGWQGQ